MDIFRGSYSLAETQVCLLAEGDQNDSVSDLCLSSIIQDCLSNVLKYVPHAGGDIQEEDNILTDFLLLGLRC
jgi:hypothetical protein